jgi:DNA invertase Pin-like site-specific DNA recombinase
VSNQVAIYLRKSRDEDNETRDITLARHEKLLLEYCDRNKLFVKKIYKEVVSGESIAARLEMQRLLVDVSAGKYDGIVCIEIERLSRGNQVDQAEILEVFKKTRTKIFTLNKTYDFSTDNEIDEEFFEFGLFMSRREYKVICRRLARGRSAALLEGYYTGSVLPYGFNKERRNKGFVLIPNKEEAEIVRLIFDKFIGGTGLTDIARYLNDQGIKPRSAKQFEQVRIREILKNKTYIGYLHVKNKKISETWVKGKHDPIIEEDIFIKAQSLLSTTRPRIKKDHTVVNPLSGLMRCDCCNRFMVVSSGGNGERYLKCVGLNCKTYSTKLKIVEDQIIKELSEELKEFKYYLDNQAVEDRRKIESRDNEINIIMQAINKKEKALDTCCELLEDGVYTREQYFKRVNILNEDIEALKSNLEALKAISDDKSESIRTTVPILEKCIEKYNDLDPKDKNIILKSFIEKIEYNKRISRGDFNLRIFLKI